MVFLLGFNPEDFLKLGNYLYCYDMDSSLREANFRTIIGRTYYFSYLFIREWAITQGFVPKNSSIDHRNIRRFLIQKKKRFISDLLRNLRIMRNKSDYDVLKGIKNTNAQTALKMAEKIRSSL